LNATRRPLPPPPGARLDHHGVADALGDLDRMLGGVDRGVVARDRVDLRLAGELLGRDLVAHRGDRRVLRADEDDALSSTRRANSSFSDRKP
jgi:hypothetical protein